MLDRIVSVDYISIYDAGFTLFYRAFAQGWFDEGRVVQEAGHFVQGGESVEG